MKKFYRRRQATGTISQGEFPEGRKNDAGQVIAKLKSYATSRKEVHQQEAKLSVAIGYLLHQIDIIANYLDYLEMTPDNNAQ